VDDEADEDTDVDMMTDIAGGKGEDFRRAFLDHTAREHVERLRKTSASLVCAIELANGGDDGAIIQIRDGFDDSALVVVRSEQIERSKLNNGTQATFKGNAPDVVDGYETGKDAKLRRQREPGVGLRRRGKRRRSGQRKPARRSWERDGR